jgi:hypothetical protein
MFWLEQPFRSALCLTMLMVMDTAIVVVITSKLPTSQRHTKRSRCLISKVGKWLPVYLQSNMEFHSFSETVSRHTWKPAFVRMTAVVWTTFCRFDNGWNHSRFSCSAGGRFPSVQLVLLVYLPLSQDHVQWPTPRNLRAIRPLCHVSRLTRVLVRRNTACSHPFNEHKLTPVSTQVCRICWNIWNTANQFYKTFHWNIRGHCFIRYAQHDSSTNLCLIEKSVVL